MLNYWIVHIKTTSVLRYLYFKKMLAYIQNKVITKIVVYFTARDFVKQYQLLNYHNEDIKK